MDDYFLQNDIDEATCSFDFSELSELSAGTEWPEITGTNGPDLWDQILALLPPKSVIGGGAVRDYLLGIEPKDIDVFVPSADYNPPLSFQPLGDDRREEYEKMPLIDIVTHGEVAGYQVDLVGLSQLDSAVDLVMTFDFGVSRCAYTTQDGIVDTYSAQMDRQNKTVTLLLNDRRERALARFARFNERMGGDWRLVEP